MTEKSFIVVPLVVEFELEDDGGVTATPLFPICSVYGETHEDAAKRLSELFLAEYRANIA